MKKRFLKIISVFIIIPIITLSFLFGEIIVGESKHLFKPYIDTFFADNYTPEKFNQIQIGWRLDEVKTLIGEPIYIDTNYNDKTKLDYNYTGDGKLISETNNQKRSRYYDFAWYRSSVTIDTNNIVVSIDKGWSYD